MGGQFISRLLRVVGLEICFSGLRAEIRSRRLRAAHSPDGVQLLMDPVSKLDEDQSRTYECKQSPLPLGKAFQSPSNP